MLRRFTAAPCVGAVVFAATSSVSLLRTQRRCSPSKPVDDADPFNERAGWDGPLHLAPWNDVDIDALVEEIENPEVQRQHFGPDYVRAKQLARVAVARKGGLAGLRLNRDGEQPSSAPDAPAGVHPEMRSEGSGGAEGKGGSDDRLVNTLTPEELRAAKFIMYSDAKVPTRMVEQEDVVTADAEAAPTYRAPEAMEVPRSIRKEKQSKEEPSVAASAATTDATSSSSSSSDEQNVEHPEGKSGAASSAATAAAVDKFGLPVTDPLQWGTEEVILWIRTFGPAGGIDEDMYDAFRMATVTGNTLLNKVTPPDLFKLMRKWHLRRAKLLKEGGDAASLKMEKEEIVSLTTLQETIILSFPYGPP